MSKEEEFYFVDSKGKKKSFTEDDGVSSESSMDEEFPFVAKQKNVQKNRTEKLLENPDIQGAAVGAVTGALLKAKQMHNEARDTRIADSIAMGQNAPMSKKGLQGYLSGAIPNTHYLPIKELERLVGMPIRTASEVQKALKLVVGSPAERVPNVVETPMGKKTIGYKTIPAIEGKDLSPYERTLLTNLKIAGGNTASVLGGLARGAAFGATGAPMAYQMVKQEEPTDWTQWTSLLGSGLGMTRSGPLGYAGAAMQIPYAVKHREELARGLTLGDISPTAFGGLAEGMETPVAEAMDDQRQRTRSISQQTPFQGQRMSTKGLNPMTRQAWDLDQTGRPEEPIVGIGSRTVNIGSHPELYGR